MPTVIAVLAQAAGEAAEAAEGNDPRDLYPHASELIVGAIAFFILLGFMARWVLPRLNAMLEERRQKIQGQLEEAERTRRDADRLLAEYREKLRDARGEANRIIEESRKTADQLRRDVQAKAEQEGEAIVARAREAIAAERDRTFEELRAQVAVLAVDLAGVVVGKELDAQAHRRLIDEYIDGVEASGNGKGGA
jgi:F-type H+-transporting ATPase subunit b